MQQLIFLYGTFMLVSLSGALSPGPLVAMAITEGARAGRWSGLRLALGHGLVEIPLVFGIAYGLGVWLRQPLVSGVIGIAGAVVLLWMGYGLTTSAYRGEMRLAPSPGETVRVPGSVRFGQIPGGAILTLTNPFWSLWWATLGAAYVGRVMALQMGPATVGGLAVTHWLTDLGWLGLLSLLTASGRGVIGERGYRAVLLVCGVFLLAFGVFMGWSGIGFLSGR